MKRIYKRFRCLIGNHIVDEMIEIATLEHYVSYVKCACGKHLGGLKVE